MSKIDKMETATKIRVIFLGFCILVLPVILVWTFLFEGKSEPIVITDMIYLFIIEVVSGVGALGIGMMIADKYIEMEVKREVKRRL